MAEPVVRTERRGPVATIWLASPRTRNAISLEIREQLGAAVDEVARDRSVRSVLLAAEGRSFCAGGDLTTIRDGCDPWSVHRRFRDMSRWLEPLIRLDKPLVVAVQGHAVGAGLGLALTGDVLIASENATFTAGFFRLGAIPDVAVMYHLPRLIGMAQAKHLLFGGGTLTASDAQRLGLVSTVVSDTALHDAALKEADRLAQGPAEVMGLAKVLMARSFETSLADMLAFEGLGQALAMSNPEFREGLSALMERREADFVQAAGRHSSAQP